MLLNPRWPAGDRLLLEKTASRILDERAQEPSLILSSSGTSAGSWREVKLILIAKRAMLAGARAATSHFSISSADRLMMSLPEFHVGGLAVSARAFVSGASLASMPIGAWRVEDFLARGSASGSTVISLVPTQLHDLTAANSRPWPELRLVFLGGGSLPADLEVRARKLGWPVVVTYGMTETSAMVAVRTEKDPTLGLGPLPGVSFATEGGRLRIRAESLATGFARRWEDGRTEWTALIDVDGWLTTEDRARLVGGRLFVEGRHRDWIKIAGESVNVAALQGILLEQALKMGISPVGFHLTWVPDERRGAVIALFVASEGDWRGLQERYNAKTLPFEKIREIVKVPEIPRTELGKVRDEELRRRSDGKA